MLSGRPYKKVRACAKSEGLLHTGGASVDRLVRILERSTRRRWRVSWPDEFLPVAECRAVIRSPRPIALLLRCPCGCGSSHWVAAEAGYVYCPGEQRPCRLSQYPRAAWVLRRIVSRAR